jgi:hypothetical protein
MEGQYLATPLLVRDLKGRNYVSDYMSVALYVRGQQRENHHGGTNTL